MRLHEDLTDGKFAAQFPRIGKRNIPLDDDGEIYFHVAVELKSRH